MNTVKGIWYTGTGHGKEEAVGPLSNLIHMNKDMTFCVL